MLRPEARAKSELKTESEKVEGCRFMYVEENDCKLEGQTESLNFKLLATAQRNNEIMENTFACFHSNFT